MLDSVLAGNISGPQKNDMHEKNALITVVAGINKSNDSGGKETAGHFGTSHGQS